VKQNLEDVKKVRKILKYHWPKKKIGYIREFPEGFNNLAFDVHFVNSKENKVVKIIKTIVSEHGSKKESKIFNLLKKKFLNYPVPRVIKFDNSKKIIDKAYIITQRLKGKTFAKMYPKIYNKEEIFEKIGEFMGLMHSIKFKQYGKLDQNVKVVESYKSWYRKRSFEVNKLFKKLNKKDYLPEGFVNKQEVFWKNNKHHLKKETKPCLCHGDSGHSNIIVYKKSKNYKISGFIDFEFANSGGGVYDLFKAVQRFERIYEFRHRIVKGYTRYSNLPDNWEELMFIYQWLENLKWLKDVQKMKWRNLTKKEDEQRRKQIIKNSVIKVNKIVKDFN
jgi:Ser/Thr protein kinase RdoA (MazF antagonist)|tara:strand:+ start:238 stop:1236 length:999 start_codon:yes stop_codon:yes gene_type:complete